MAEHEYFCTVFQESCALVDRPTLISETLFEAAKTGNKEKAEKALKEGAHSDALVSS